MRFSVYKALSAFALLFTAGFSGPAHAASFQITGLGPVGMIRGASPPPLTATITVLQPGSTLEWNATLEGNPGWASLSQNSGTGAGTITITLAANNLVPGVFTTALVLNSGGTVSRQAITLNSILPNVVKMEADLTRPVIYALHRGAGAASQAGFLLVLNTETGKVDQLIPAGTNPTDFDISYAESRIYVANHGSSTGSIRVIDPAAGKEVRTMDGGVDVYKINAGKNGRLVTEGFDQWIYADLLDSSTGARLVRGSEREGDGEFEPTGRYYYRSDNNNSDASLTRYDMSADTFAAPVSGVERAFGTRNLVMSGDGSRLFWQKYVYDRDLNELRTLGTEIYSTTFRGEIAFSNNKAFNVITGAELATLPVTSTVSAVSGDQTKLFQFNPATSGFTSTLMSTIGTVPPPVAAPVPADNAVIFTPLPRLQWSSAAGALKYKVYFGTDAAAVAAASPASPEYLGETEVLFKNLPAALVPGTAYFWRIDPVGFSSVTAGPVWRFTTSALEISVNALTQRLPRVSQPRRFAISTSAAVSGSWTASESLSWLTLSAAGGTSGDPLTVTFNPAGLAAGIHTGEILIGFAGTTGRIPVTFELFDMELTKMIAHPGQPWIYGLHPGSTANPSSYVVFIQSTLGQIVNAIPVGIGATDLTIDRHLGKLYINNWQGNSIQVIQTDSQSLLAPIPSSREVYRISAGRVGRLYTEGESQWVNLRIVNSLTGAELPEVSVYVGAGDGEVDPSGRFYYHFENNSTGSQKKKYDVSEDKWTQLSTSPIDGGYGRNLIMSPDGSRLFWEKQVYDADLTLLRTLGGEVYATTQRGEFAFTSQQVLNAGNGGVVASLPVSSTVSVVSSDQKLFCYYNATLKNVGFVSMDTIAPVPPPGTTGDPPNSSVQLAPVPRLSWDVADSAVKYRVFFGTSEAAVSAATTASAAYLGETFDRFMDLPAGLVAPGGQYFWRVDRVGFTNTTAGAVLTFNTLAVTVSPKAVEHRSITGAPPQIIRLAVSGGSAGTTWTTGSGGASFLTVLTPSGVTGENLEIQLAAGSLPAGVYNTSVVLASGGKSVQIPVKFIIEAPSYTALLADPERPRLYALQRPDTLEGAVVVINTNTEDIERVIPVSKNPTGFDLTADGRFLYVITKAGRKVHRINLTDWTMEDRALAESNDHQDSTRYRMAAGSGTKVYWTDGEWTPRLHSMDFATGLETGPAILSDGSSGFGALARTADGAGLVAWSQHGWYNGTSNSVAWFLNTAGVSATVVSRGVPFDQSPMDTPALVRRDGSAVFMKGSKLGNDLNQVLTQYPADIYAITPGRGIVFGATAAWRESTATPVWQAPAGVDARISAVTGDAAAFYYFNTTTKKLVRVAMANIGDVPGPLPEDGEVVDAMPAALAWTPKAGAIRYEVYFGTDPVAVQAASGQASPVFLGSSTTPSLPLNVPFQTAGGWWWRVDTVLDGSTTKGAVWKFTGSLTYLGLYKGSNVGYSSTTPPALAVEGTTILSGYSTYSLNFSSTPGQMLVHNKRLGAEEWELSQIINKPGDAAASAGFGNAIAMKGDTAWVSAPSDTNGGRIFEYRKEAASSQWRETGRSLRSPSAAANDSFGASLAFDGQLIVVGQPGASSAQYYQSGAVEIFDAATLTRQVRITEPVQTSSARFGSKLALHNGTLALANPFRVVSGQPAGAIDIWTRLNGTTWSRATILNCPVPASNRGFGSSLAFSGDRLYVGTSSELSAGKVFNFVKQAGPFWALTWQIPRAGGLRTDQYSANLAASGDLIAIAAPSQTNAGDEVWLHRQTGPTGWTSIAPAIPGTTKSLFRYGAALALTNRYLVTGWQTDSNQLGGFTVHLHNPAANLPPAITSGPVPFAEAGRLWKYELKGIDENTGEILTFSAVSTLPSWLTLSPAANGRALLSGTPPAGGDPLYAIRIRLTDAAGDFAEQNFNLSVLPGGSIPQITASTGDLTSDDGKPLTLSVTVPAGSQVDYQWYRNGLPLSGETGPDLNIRNGQMSDAGTYHVRVSRNGIWVETDLMTLTINQVPDRFGGDWPTFGATPSHAGTYPAMLGKHKLLPAWNIPYIGSNQVVTGGGRVYSVQGSRFGQDSAVSAYDAATGARLWSTPLPSSSSVNPPTYYRGRVYMQRGKGTGDIPDLRCYDAVTGTLIWTSTFGAQWENYFAPAVDDTGIYINGGTYGGLYRFGLDGRQQFFQGLAQFDSWTPLLHQGKLYSWVSGTFTNHEILAGSPVYSLTVPSDWRGYAMNTVPAAEGNVAVMRSTTEVFAVDLAARRVLWKRPGTFNGSPALKNGIAYVIGMDGVESFDALTGTPGRVYPTRSAANVSVMAVHQPVLLDDTLVVSSDTLTWTFDLPSGTLLQRLTGGGALTYSDGFLMAAGTDSTLRAWKVNQPSRLTPQESVMAATEDLPFQWEIQVTDPDADVPAITISGLPAWLTAAPLQNGFIRFSGTPLNVHHGAFSINVLANDGKSFPASLLINGSVIPVNDTPAATNRTLARDEDAAAEDLILTELFSDEETPGTALRYSIVSHTGTAVMAVLDHPGDTTLRLTYPPDGFGQSVITLRAMDPEGLTADSVITVNVAPVNDAPVMPTALPAISAGDAALGGTVDFAPFARDVDAGDILSWRILSNTNPALFSRLEMEASGRLIIQYAPYVSGQAIVTVEVRDQTGAAASQSFAVNLPALPSPSVETKSSLTLNRQTGLWEQRVTVRNTGLRAIGGFEINVSGLPAGANLYNASDARPPAYMAGYYQPVAAGESVTLTLEYYSPSRSALNPVLTTAVLLPRDPVSTAAGSVRIDRMMMMEPGAFLLEFTAEPGELYQVQYSNGAGWTDSMVRIRAAGNRVQWIDRGAPRTNSPPQPGTSRFYRVKHLPAP